MFTWGSKAITPYVGWIGGYALLLSSVLAGVGAAGITVNAVTTSWHRGRVELAATGSSPRLFIVFTTWLVGRGAEESSRTTMLLTVIQYGGLILFAAILVLNVIRRDKNPTAEAFSWDWFNPFAIDSFAALLGGFLVAVFIFWGFDAALSMSEETAGTPGSPAGAG